ncbi:acd-1 [Pristionchus pacificus]|uniref:Acd-1 n=1 Tax=Pristionchus pacificus TaxID=54126 RepID=A0A2A6CCB6_PRIPA|nr:acd-1 [Pristionchus pacificus]|eukprot:PDM75766.1 acd-1 [Pristionchus pacificus]
MNSPRVTFDNDIESCSSSTASIHDDDDLPYRREVNDDDDDAKRESTESPTKKEKRNSLSLHLSQSAQELKKRASHMIVQVPVAQIKKIKQTEGLSSLEKETQYFVGITSMHGVLRIYKSKGWSAWLWGTLYAICGFLLLWQTINLILLFTAKPTVSFLITEQGITFPKITVCNFNPIRKSFILKINETGDFSDALLSYLMQSNSDVLAIYGNANETKLMSDDADLKAYMERHPNFNINEFFYNAGFSCDDVMKLCFFGGRSFDCCGYSTPVLTSLGRCHVINLRDSPYEWMRKQTEEGVDSGLQIILDTHLEEQFDGIGSDPDPVFSNQFENGFRYYVSEPDVSTYKTAQGISVSPGFCIYSALSPKSYTLLDQHSWGNCTHGWPEGYTGGVTQMKYSASDCLSKCKARFYHDHCGCSPFVYNIDTEFPSCTPLETYECTKQYIVVNKDETSEEFHWPKCEECVVECERWEFNAANSYGNGFSNGALRWLNQYNPEWTTPHIRANFLTINIFFRDMSYTEYKQVQAMSMTELMSDMGGNMGLFWGMSVLTLAESLIYIWKISWIAVSKSRREYMLEKKKRDEKEERETEETIKSFKQLSAAQLAQIAAAQAQYATDGVPFTTPSQKQSVAGRIRKWTTTHWGSIRRKTGRVTPASRRSSANERGPKTSVSSLPANIPTRDARERFMDRYLENMLNGSGRAEKMNSSSEDSPSGSVIELKIDLNDLQRSMALETASPTEVPMRIVARKAARKYTEPPRKRSTSGAAALRKRSLDDHRNRFPSDPMTDQSSSLYLDAPRVINSTIRPSTIAEIVDEIEE